MNNNPKIIVTNIIVVVLAVLSVITLCVGNFFAVKLTIRIDDELLTSVAEEQLGEGETDELDYAAIFEGIDMEIPFSFQIKSAVLLKAATGDSNEAVRSMLSNQLDVVVDDLLNLVDEIIETFATVMINTVVEEAKEQIINELKESLGGDPTEEQVMQELQSEYGISEEDIDTLGTDMANVLTAFLEGGPDAVSETLENSETLDNLVSVYAEQALIEEQGEGTYSQAEIDAKAQELKDELVDQFEEATSEWAPEGEMSEGGVVAWLFNQVAGDEGTGIHNLDEVKEYITDQIFGEMDDSAVNAIGTALKFLGIFLLIVIGAWVYLILKILVKLFAGNKTVGMFFPKFFGWMPYVIFVGIPAILTKNMGSILNQAAQRFSMDPAAVTTFNDFSSWITIKFSALTWVSALCSVALMVIWFPYHRWRKDAKAARRAGR